MKVVLAALNAKYVHSNLAVYDIAAYTKVQLNQASAGKGHPEIMIKEYTINHNLDEILQSLYEEKANVVAFSCYIWNIQEILTVAKELHKVSPKTGIWLGGPEVSYNCEGILKDYSFVEGIMQGEGEATFYELVTVWWNKRRAVFHSAKGSYNGEERYNEKEEQHYREYIQQLSEVKGIVYRDCHGTIQKNEARGLLSLDEIPFVYDDLDKFKNKILYYETSRGCPFSCSYCLSSIDKSVRFRNFHLVEKELQFFLEHKVAQVKFIDRTFNCKRDHALAIWQYLLEHDNGVTNFHFEIAADLIGQEELEIFRKMRPGLIQLEIGLQSTNPKTIKEIRRVMDVAKLKSNLHRIRGFHNIHQHLDLIAGLPYEDFSSFQRSFNEAYAMKPNQLQLGFLKVLKGSYMGEQVKNYALTYQDVQPYEVLSTKWLSYDEVLALKQVEEMVEVYYNSDQFEHVLPYLLSMTTSPYAFYEAIGLYYKEHQLFGIGFKREKRYEVLRNFAISRFGKNELWNGDTFDGLLIFDYYLRENAKNRPVWNQELPIDKKRYQEFFKNGGNEQYHFKDAHYDSKVAARTMHIEPVSKECLSWLLEEGEFECCFGCDNSDLEKDGYKHNEQRHNSRQYYCLFDYENRNRLTKDAKVVMMDVL